MHESIRYAITFALSVGLLGCLSSESNDDQRSARGFDDVDGSDGPNGVAPSTGGEPAGSKPAGSEDACSDTFECDTEKLCTDCPCECPGLIELWSGVIPKFRHFAPGPDDETYFLLEDAPWIARVARDGERLDIPDYDLEWTRDLNAGIGVDSRGRLAVTAVVSPQGEADIHLERFSKSGDRTFSETFTVITEDRLLGVRTFEDDSFVLVGQSFIARLDADDELTIPVTSSNLSGAAAVIGTERLLLLGSTTHLTGLDGSRLASRTFSDTGQRYCSATVGVDDGLYELCSDVSSGRLSLELHQLGPLLERTWTHQETNFSNSVVAAVGPVVDGALFSTSSPSTTRRFNRLGDELADLPNTSGRLIPLTSTDSLSVSFSGSTVRRLYAPPLIDTERTLGESCADNTDCESQMCCRREGAGSLGTCGPSGGCDPGSLCHDSDQCAGICDSAFANPAAPRCRATCDDDDDCETSEHCVELPCGEDQSCAAVCLTDCLARGSDACDDSSTCRELQDEIFACAPACTDVECGSEDGVQCSSCPERTTCMAGTCVAGTCFGWECGVDDGVGCGSCDPGQFCTSEHQCETACQNVECGTDHGTDCGTCGTKEICDSGHCREACTDIECGTDDGIDCGSCGSEEYCDAGRCLAACDGMECGEDHGLACGDCAADEYCEQNQCAAACTNMECGSDHGIGCGTCDATAYCNATNHCVPACANVECGTDNGVDCGGCPQGQACDRGICITAACDPNSSTFCDGDAIYACTNGGVSASFVESCAIYEYCRQDGQGAACVADVCRYLAAGCDGDVFGTCNAQGSGLDSSGQIDCAAQGLQCSRSGCGDVTVHEIGLPPTGGADLSTTTYWVVGNFYEVTTNTTLVEYRPYFDITAWDLTWNILRSESRDGPYTTVQRLRSATGGAQTGLLQFSPEYTYELEAGYYYFLGVEGEARQVDAIAFASSETAAASVDFGTVLGGYIGANGGGSLEFVDTGYIVSQELTTVVLPVP